ncbi:MAG TPA: hypothetical protein VFK43_08980 [Acidimicrobiales bacterium]|nr:hypothetical protein [Acidimicrobiales bacterium]
MAMHRDAWNELFKTPSGPTWAGWVAPTVAVSVVLGAVALSGGGNDVLRPSAPQVAAPALAPPTLEEDVPAPTPAPPVLPVADPAPAPVAPEPAPGPVRAVLIAHVTPAPAPTPTPSTVPPVMEPSARKPVPTTVAPSEPTLSIASAKNQGNGQKVSHQAQKQHQEQQQGSAGHGKPRGRRGPRR